MYVYDLIIIKMSNKFTLRTKYSKEIYNTKKQIKFTTMNTSTFFICKTYFNLLTTISSPCFFNM